jgi:NlpC/P60 family
VSVSGASILAEAKKFLGDPYIYGADGPSSFDCSGLVQYTLTQLGIKGVPRTSEAQWGWVDKIPASQLQPGDLVFSQWPGDNASPGHVGIYAGGGKILEASHSGTPVHLVSLDAAYKAQVVGYGKVPGASTSGSSGGGGVLGGLLSLPSSVTTAFSAAEDLLHGLMWIINPENWARILAGVFGAVLAVAGLGFLLWAA